MTGLTTINPLPRRAAAGHTLALGLAALALLPAAEADDLADRSLEELMQVSVVGASKYEQKQSEVAAAVNVITRQEIRESGWRTLDEALASLPGVYTTYDRQYSYLGTRGFSVPGDFNTRVLLTINGNRVNDAVYDQAYIGREFPLDLDLVERIEFIPGPGGAVYGQNALFGVINVITRKGADLNGSEVAADYQQPQELREARASWGRHFDSGVDAALSVSGMHAPGEDRFYTYGASGLAGVARGLDGESDERIYATVSLNAWSAEYVQGDRRKDDPTGIYQSDPLTPGTYQRDKMHLAQVQYQDSFAGGMLQLSARAFLGQERYNAPEEFGGVLVYSTAASDWHGLELRALSTAFHAHKLMLGFEYQDNTRQDEAFVPVTSTPGLADAVVPVSGWRAGAYAQDDWTLGRSLNATVGLRADRNSTTGNTLSPRVGLIWQARAATAVKLLYGQAHRAPNAYEFSYSDGVTEIGNSNLRVETIDTQELVIDQRISRDLAVRVSLYRWIMRDLLTLGTDPVSGLPQYQNGQPVNARGIELSADRTWEPGARLRGSVSYQRATYDSGTRLNNSPSLLGKLNFSAPLASLRLRLDYEFQYSSPRQSLDGTDLGGYGVSNITVIAEHWLPRLELRAGVYNLLDKHYALPASRNNWQNSLEQDGRALRLSATCRF